jgi:hypothetical protein
MSEVNTAAGVYATNLHLEDALRQLRRHRVGAEHLSIVGRGDPRDAQVASLAGRRLELDSPLCGAFWVAGPLADSIEASLRERGSLNGHGELAVGLLRVGVSESDTREYERALAHGESLLFVYGSLEEIARTLEVLSDGARAVRLHMDCRWAA